MDCQARPRIALDVDDCVHIQFALEEPKTSPHQLLVVGDDRGEPAGAFVRSEAGPQALFDLAQGVAG